MTSDDYEEKYVMPYFPMLYKAHFATGTTLTHDGNISVIRSLERLNTKYNMSFYQIADEIDDFIKSLKVLYSL